MSFSKLRLTAALLLQCLSMITFNTRASYGAIYTSTENYINKHVQFLNTDNNNIKTVIIENSYKIDIYYPSAPIDGLGAFYTAVACEFTKWTLTQTNKVIEYYPSTSRSKFENDSWFSSNEKQEKVSLIFKLLKLNTTRFIGILKKILHANYGYVSYAHDTTILRVFLMIKTKVHLISPRVFETSYAKPIPSVRKEIAELRGFLLKNCSVVPPSKIDSNDNPPIDRYDEVSENSYLDAFMKKINDVIYFWPYKLYDPDVFLEDYMFLEKLVTIGSDDRIKNDILNANVVATVNRSVTVGDILTNDMEAVYMLDGMIFNVAIKLLIAKISVIRRNGGQLNNATKNLINKLIKGIVLDNARTKDFMAYCVHLYGHYISSPFQIESVRVVETLENCVRKFSNVSAINATNENVTGDDEIYVYELSKRLNEELDTFARFRILLKIVQENREKYCPPFEKIDVVHYLPVVDRNDSCLFASNLYRLCGQALFYYNQCCRNGAGDDKTNASSNAERFRESARRIFARIKAYTVTLIEDEAVEDMDLLKMASNVAALLVNEPIFDNVLCTKALKMTRATNVIVNELNKYTAAKSCGSPAFDSLPCDGDFANFADDRGDRRESMNEFVGMISDDSDGVSTERCRFLDARRLFSAHVEGNVAFEAYSDAVQMVWNGKQASFKKTLKNAFEDDSINASQTLFVFYNIFFLNYMAVFFYEYTMAYWNTGAYKSQTTTFRLFQKFSSKLDLRSDRIPRRLKYLVEDVTLNINSSDEKPLAYYVIAKYTSMFQRLSTVFTTSSSSISRNLRVYRLKTIYANTFRDVDKSLKNSVRLMYTYLLKFQPKL